MEGIGAATDYVGLGPEGEIHPYLSRVSEGNSMIDIVTAAAQLPGAVASPRWVAVGHSQGGHAALAAHELAAARAPSLQLSATAALAPGVDTDTSYGVDDDLMTALTMMQLYGGAGEHEDIDPADYLTPAALGQAEVFSTGCVEAIIDAMGGVAAAGPFEVDPWSNEPARTMLESNRVGTERVEGVPVLLALGSGPDGRTAARAGALRTPLRPGSEHPHGRGPRSRPRCGHPGCVRRARLVPAGRARGSRRGSRRLPRTLTRPGSLRLRR
ncbi:MAG: lipase family protein [Microthrixaceae bacterium]